MPLFKKRDEPGMYNGRHYTEYVEPVKALKRSGKYDEAETLLLGLVGAVESEANDSKSGVSFSPPPWYYDELAKITAVRRITRLRSPFWSVTFDLRRQRLPTPPTQWCLV